MSKFYLLVWVLMIFGTAHAAEIKTNNVWFPSPPKWLELKQVENATTKMQNFLEWDIRMTKVSYVAEAKAFEELHHFGPTVEAFFQRSSGQVFLGPKVNHENFEAIFGHELAHVIIFQKYHDAIPAWLEEGLANYAAKKGTVDYPWLVKQTQVPARSLAHPYGGKTDPRYHYQASTALVEMIAAKCSLSELLQLSVGKKLEDYLPTFCEISDLDEQFQKWLQLRSQLKPAAKKKANKG